MQSVWRLVGLVSIAVALIWSRPANAGIVTVDLPQDVVPGTPVSFGNATADGFRLSPSGEYTLVPPGGGGSGIIATGLGWDSDGPGNPTYLGGFKLGTASLFVDKSATPFSLMSADFVSSGFDDAFEVVSSKGGVYDVPHMIGAMDVSFSGPDWTGIDWLIFGYFDAGAPTVGLERLVMSVEEPATLASFAFGLLGLLAWHGRSVQRRRAVAAA